jgi:signal transduction histidine kinase
MYGERDDPYVVLSRLGQRLEGTLAPEAVLPTVVATVREVLRLPYVAIYLKHDLDAFKIVAESASPTLRSEGEALRVPGMESDGMCAPLVHQGETVGYIVLGPRAPGEAFSPTDRRLLDDLARQAGVAVHAVRLTADLQRSRERLVTAREEESRRLRRDLHDGLGSQLAALHLRAGTLRGVIPHDLAAADAGVVELQAEIRAAIADIRRLVYELRPPALDELGLAGALRGLAAQCTAADGLQVRLDVPEQLPPLPAAVEVAAYRIAQEALTNVVRHARAHTCEIRLMLADDLRLEIKDDGIGLSPEPHAGVGLRSMHERAAELGGTWAVETASGGGARVRVRLPLPPAKA